MQIKLDTNKKWIKWRNQGGNQKVSREKMAVDCDTAKAVPRGEFIATQIYFKKQEKSQSILMFQLKERESKKQKVNKQGK